MLVVPASAFINFVLSRLLCSFAIELFGGNLKDSLPHFISRSIIFAELYNSMNIFPLKLFVPLFAC